MPKCGCEQYQHREKLKTAYQHNECEKPFSDIRHYAVRLAITGDSSSESGITYT